MIFSPNSRGWLDIETALKSQLGRVLTPTVSEVTAPSKEAPGTDPEHPQQTRRPSCPRCGGWLSITIEFGDEASMSKRIPRCLICGKRFYRGMAPVLPTPQGGFR